MKQSILSSIDHQEVLRYMGCPPNQADVRLLQLVDQCAATILEVACPRWIYQVVSVIREEGGVRLSNGLWLPGRDFPAHIDGCQQVVVFCATLSAQVDHIIRQAENRDMLQALALDCCATAAVEQLCDHIEMEIQTIYSKFYFPFRYSPGYGDLPLSVQNQLLMLLDASRKIGLCATSNHILTPRKSVTALIGLSPNPVSSSKRSCLNCPAEDHCQYRKAGGHCGTV